ncbi:hypothetical protein ACFO7V_16905 [Glutamicibacter bergerei]|uniref:Uncharacterized protein n=1 Tax=Glutamicibacter bergerei TaxID=256702 RepID=A0ABV9MT07_9MICC|nr:hypothetical protein [Micrococcaceae bacterium]
MTLIPNQPYPNLPAWETITGIFLNGWIGEGVYYLRALQGSNSTEISARIRIGSERRIAGYMPTRFHPALNQNLLGFIQGGPQVVMEFWSSGALALSNNSLSMTEAEMLAVYGGRDVYFAGVIPRKAV